MTVFALSKKGYGNIDFIRSLDSDDFMDLIEYENICNDIETIMMEEARKN
jgi:dihydroneopterin aldolase